MSIIAISGLSIVSAILCLTIKKQSGDLSLIICIATSVLLLLSILSSVNSVLGQVREIFSNSNINSNYMSVLLKSFGICFLTEFTSDVCKDSGQVSLSGNVVFAGKIAVLIIALPLFNEILNTALSLMGG